MIDNSNNEKFARENIGNWTRLFWVITLLFSISLSLTCTLYRHPFIHPLNMLHTDTLYTVWFSAQAGLNANGKTYLKCARFIGCIWEIFTIGANFFCIRWWWLWWGRCCCCCSSSCCCYRRRRRCCWQICWLWLRYSRHVFFYFLLFFGFDPVSQTLLSVQMQ